MFCKTLHYVQCFFYVKFSLFTLSAHGNYSMVKPAVTDFLGHLGAAETSREHNTDIVVNTNTTFTDFSLFKMPLPDSSLILTKENI